MSRSCLCDKCKIPAGHASKTPAVLTQNHSKMLSPLALWSPLALSLTGLFLFPALHIFFTIIQKRVFSRGKYVDRFNVSTRIVSGLQAMLASAVGFRVVLSCTDIMKERHPEMMGYIWFGLAYFYYDVVVMFWGTYLEERDANSGRNLWEIWKLFFKKRKVIILHHVLVPVIGFPIVASWRKEQGDFFLATLFLNEMSTPFLSVRAILEIHGQTRTKLYAINGILLALFFLVFRVLVHPYLYWCYSRYSGISFLKVPFNIPLICNCCCFAMMSLQLYWFYMIAKGIVRFLKTGITKKPKTDSNKNGHGLTNNHALVADKNGCPAPKTNGLKIH